VVRRLLEQPIDVRDVKLEERVASALLQRQSH
jgi:hypothetical protein